MIEAKFAALSADVSSVSSGSLFAFWGMFCVGSSVAVSQALVDAPLFTVQASRYALATALFLIFSAALTGRYRDRVALRGSDWVGWPVPG